MCEQLFVADSPAGPDDSLGLVVMLCCMKLQASLPSAGEACSSSSFVLLVVVVVLPRHWVRKPLVIVVVSS